MDDLGEMPLLGGTKERENCGGPENAWKKKVFGDAGKRAEISLIILGWRRKLKKVMSAELENGLVKMAVTLVVKNEANLFTQILPNGGQKMCEILARQKMAVGKN